MLGTAAIDKDLPTRICVSFKPALAIGPLTLDGCALLAPMSGVTDVVMRRLAARFGASAVVSEMVACDQFVLREAEASLRAEGAGVFPHIVQLAGRDPHWVAEAARLAEANGADVVDLNMGCPAKRVTGGYAGSALMRDLDLAARLIEAAVSAVSVPVTVKMRLGWDENSLNAPVLAARAEGLGARLITVHGRTRNQFYKGSANWQAVRAVVEATRLPVVVNGDVDSLGAARDALASSGAAGVMIGRASLGQPWLVGMIARGLAGREQPAALDGEEIGAVMAEHYDGLLDHFGLKTGVRHARKHLAAYLTHLARDGRAAAARVQQRVLTSEEPAEVRRLLAEVCREQEFLAA